LKNRFKFRAGWCGGYFAVRGWNYFKPYGNAHGCAIEWTAGKMKDYYLLGFRKPVESAEILIGVIWWGIRFRIVACTNSTFNL